MSSAACLGCCEGLSTAGAALHDAAMPCLCAACDNECGTNGCAATPAPDDAACELCFENSANGCATQQDACEADADCLAVAACATNCNQAQ